LQSAQERAGVCVPGLVVESDTDDILHISPMKLIPVLWKAVQDLSKKVSEQNALIQQLLHPSTETELRPLDEYTMYVSSNSGSSSMTSINTTVTSESESTLPF